MIKFLDFFKEAIGYKDEADIQEAANFLRQYENELKFFVDEFLPRMNKLQFFKYDLKNMSKEDKINAAKILKDLNFEYLNQFRYDLNFKDLFTEVEAIKNFKASGDFIDINIKNQEDLQKAFSLCDNIKFKKLSSNQFILSFEYKNKTREILFATLFNSGKFSGIHSYLNYSIKLNENLLKYLIELMQQEGFNCKKVDFNYSNIEIKSFTKNV